MKLRILALIVALPSIILLLNLTMYAMTGTGFLAPSVDRVNEARISVAFLSVSTSVLLFGASLGT
jgi:hypothetical protein